MNAKIIVTGAVLAGGVLCKKVNEIILSNREKREQKIKEEWFNKGWDKGFEAGKDDSRLDNLK